MLPSRYQNLGGDFDDCFGVWEPAQTPRVAALSLFECLSREIDETSNAIMGAKFEKLAKQFLDDTYLALQGLCTKYVEQPSTRKQIEVKFELLEVDHANLQLLPRFYEIVMTRTKHIDRHKIFSGDMTAYNGEVVAFSSRMHRLSGAGDSASLLSEIVDCLRKQLRKPAQVYTSVFLVERCAATDLRDLQKTLAEEMEYNLQCDRHHSVVIMLPATHQILLNHNSRKKYVFTDPRKNYISLLMELLKNTRVPMLSRTLYKELSESFGVYATTYAHQIHHLKLAMYQYVKACPQQLKDRLLRHLADEEVKHVIFQEYLALRRQIKFAIDALHTYIKRLRAQNFDWLHDKKQKLFSMICRDQTHFMQLPQGTIDGATIKLLLDEFILSVKSTLPNSETLCSQIEAAVETGYTTQPRPKKDRYLQMVQPTDKQQKYLHDKRDRLQDEINRFIKENITDLVILLENQKSEYIFHDALALQKIYAPDILQDYHNVLYVEQGGYDTTDKNVMYTPYHHVRSLYASVGSGGLSVRACDLQSEMPAYAQHRGEMFHYGVGEMKLLGLLEETSKVQMTFQKSYFAKAVFEAYRE